MMFGDIKNNTGVRYIHTCSKLLANETVLTYVPCSTFSVLCNIQNQIFSQDANGLLQLHTSRCPQLLIKLPGSLSHTQWQDSATTFLTQIH